jgi:hypothetical protein
MVAPPLHIHAGGEVAFQSRSSIGHSRLDALVLVKNFLLFCLFGRLGLGFLLLVVLLLRVLVFLVLGSG